MALALAGSTYFAVAGHPNADGNLWAPTRVDDTPTAANETAAITYNNTAGTPVTSRVMDWRTMSLAALDPANAARFALPYPIPANARAAHFAMKVIWTASVAANANRDLWMHMRPTGSGLGYGRPVDFAVQGGAFIAPVYVLSRTLGTQSWRGFYDWTMALGPNASVDVAWGYRNPYTEGMAFGVVLRGYWA